MDKDVDMMDGLIKELSEVVWTTTTAIGIYLSTANVEIYCRVMYGNGKIIIIVIKW